MQTIAGSPFAWLTFDADGTLSSETPIEDVRRLAAAPGITDIVVISHGWKNDAAEAHHLYETLWRNVVAALPSRAPGTIVVCGVRWPAKAFGADIDGAALQVGAQGGILSAPKTPGTVRRDLDAAELDEILADFTALFEYEGTDDVAAAARAAASNIDHARARTLFAKAATLMGPTAADSELARDTRPLGAEDAYDRLIGLAKPPKLTAAPETGQALGLGSAVREAFAGPRAAVARFLNQLTYFEMKARAGRIGAALGGIVLPQLQMPAGIRLHLVGHSFGARLVTAATSAMPPDLPLFSLVLLQGAFSHNALAAVVEPGRSGAFANVIGRPSGPIVVTHTHQDRACTLWYAIASRLSRDNAAALGDANDPFGAMGANGPQKLDAGVLAADNTGEPFNPVAGRVNRFRADGYIVATKEIDAHNNVTNETVGRLIAAVLEMPVPPRTV